MFWFGCCCFLVDGQSVQSTILDYRLEFEKAARKYIEVANEAKEEETAVLALGGAVRPHNSPRSQFPTTDCMHCSPTACFVPFVVLNDEVQVMCAILAKAGPTRARLLRDLYRDQRSEQLKIIKILEKVHAPQEGFRSSVCFVVAFLCVYVSDCVLHADVVIVLLKYFD